MTSRDGRTDALGPTVRRALEQLAGEPIGNHLAVAQVRVAWDEIVREARLATGPFQSRVTRVTGGTVHIEASEPALAQELTLRRDALVWALNQRMAGRPGASIVVHGLSVTVGRIGA